MSLGTARHQKPVRPGRAVAGHGEAVCEARAMKQRWRDMHKRAGGPATCWGKRWPERTWPGRGNAVADQAMLKLRDRLRQLTRRVQGRSLEQVAQDLQAYAPGWKAYFRLAQTPKVMRELDEWLRHRLRALQLKQWKRGTTMFRELRRLGASEAVAARIASNSRRWWRNSRMTLNGVLPVSYFDKLGVPRFS